MMDGIWNRLRRLATRRSLRRRTFSWSNRKIAGARQSVRLQFEPLEHRELLTVSPTTGDVRVNTNTSNLQTWWESRQSIAMDQAGNYVVTWSGLQLNVGDIFAQRFNAAGVPQGSEFLVNSNTDGSDRFSTVAMDADGDFVITWASENQDGGKYGIYAQRYNSVGAPQGTEFRVNTYTTDDQNRPSIAMSHSGEFVIAWVGRGNGDLVGIFAQQYDASGTPQGSEFRVNTNSVNDQSYPTVSADAAGSFVITWSNKLPSGSDLDVSAQRYDATGSPLGSNFRVNTYTQGEQPHPRVAVAVNGDFVVAWDSDGRDGSGYGIYAQRFNASGSPLGTEFRVNTTTGGDQISPMVAIDADGYFVVVWTHSDDNIHAQRFSPTGSPLSSEFRVNTGNTGQETYGTVAMAPNGNFVIAWSGQADDIYARQFAVTAPTVSDVRIVGDSSAIEEGERLVSSVPSGASLQVTFTEIMSQAGGASGAGSVTNPANWSLTKDGVDISSQITSVNFSGLIATLSLSTPLTSGAIVLTVNDAIQDTGGDSLDGDASGLRGGDFVRTFQIAPPVAVGSEFRVNTFTTGSQRTHEISPQSVAMDDIGNYVVTWISYGQDGNSHGVYAQRYSAAGVAQGGEFRVNSYTTNSQRWSAVAMDTDGDFVITWTSNNQSGGSDYDVYAQRYNATGVAQGGEFRVNTDTMSTQRYSAVAMDLDGDFVITWSSTNQDGSGDSVYAQRYNAAGGLQGNEFKVNTYMTSDQRLSTVAMDSDGNFVITWTSSDQDGGEDGVYAQRYNAAGVAQGGEFRVNTYTASYQRYSTVAMDSDGDFVISWTSSGHQDGDGDGVYAQRYNAAGAAQASEFKVNTSTTSYQYLSTVEMDSDGDFVITWSSYVQDGSGWGVYAQRYSAAGAAQGGEFRVNTYTTNSQRSSRLAMDSDGDFVVAWSSYGQDGSSYGIFAQRFAALSSTTNIALDGASNLVITDAAAGGQNDTLTIQSDTTNNVFIISDPNHLLSTTIAGATGSGTNTITIPFASVAGPQISVLTLDGNDSLTVDFSLGNFTKSIVYDGGNQTASDSLSLTGGGQFASVTHTFASASSGSVSVAGNSMINYSGLEPVFDNLNAIDRVFNLPGGAANSATLADDGVVANGLSRISAATFERVDFMNPGSSLTINRGHVGDSLVIGNLPDFSSGLTIGSGGNEFSVLTFAGNVTLAPHRSLVAFAQGAITLPNTFSDVATAGNGSLSLTTARNISLSSGASLATVDGHLQISANQQLIATSGNFAGIDATGGLIQVTGSGNLSLAGRGGNAAGGSQSGVRLGMVLGGATGTVTVSGTGGASAGELNDGVTMNVAGAIVTTAGGSVIVIGQGGGSATSLGNNAGVRLGSSSQITAGGMGSVVVQGAGGFTGVSGNGDVGVLVASGLITSSGGNVTVIGTGGLGVAEIHYGVFVHAGGQISAGGMGNVIVQGTGGAASGGDNDGVRVDSIITSGGGHVTVTGQGGGTGATHNNVGVGIYNGGQISAGGMGSVLVRGTGGATTGGSSHGIRMGTASTTKITSNGGDVQVIGIEGGGASSRGIVIESPGSIFTNVHGGNVTLVGNSMAIDSAATVITNSNHSVTILPYTTSVAIDLGSSTDTRGGPLSLSNAELNRVSAGTIQIANSASGSITISAPITPPANLSLTTGDRIDVNQSTIMAVDKNFTASAGNTINFRNSLSTISASGNGDITITSTRDITLFPTARISTENGDLVLSANQQPLATSGDFTGVYIFGGAVEVTGSGNLSLLGRGGTAPNTNQRGVVLANAGLAQVGGTGTISVVGTGGPGDGDFNHGVYLVNSSKLFTTAGNITIVGHGSGSAASSRNYGIHFSNASEVHAGGGGDVSILGTGGAGTTDNYGVFLANATIVASGNMTMVGAGGGSAGSLDNHGVILFGPALVSAGGLNNTIVDGSGGPVAGRGVVVALDNAKITSQGGNVIVTGTGGATGTDVVQNYGILQTNNPGTAITTASSGGNITLIASSMRLDGPVTADSSHRVTLLPSIAGMAIDLGTPGETFAGPLSLSGAELNQISAGSIEIGNATSGAIHITAAISRTSPSHFILSSGGNITFNPGSFSTGGGNLTLIPGSTGSVQPASSGKDVRTSSHATLAFGLNADLAFAINGPAVDSQYQQFKLDGQVSLTGVDLVITGSHAPLPGQAFTIIDNDGTDPVVGTFNSLPEGAVVNVNGVPRQITYVGGNGNDVVLNDLPLQVVSIAPTPTGFIAQFNHPFDPSTLNLYDEDGALGAADVKLLDAFAAEVRGSLLIDLNNRSITFLKSGGVLDAGNYTVQFMSGANAFKLAAGGGPLDGNVDGTPGGNFTGNFAVSSPAANTVTLSVPDLARGYGQTVDVPASGASGMPITISSAQGISGVDFQLNYDPALLNITAVTIGNGINGSVAFNIPTPGTLLVTISSAGELRSQPGSATLVNLTATVPTGAAYASKHLLDLRNVHIYDDSTNPTELPALDDDGIHIAAYFGDANGSQTYNAPDATAAQRLIVGLDTGFASYQLADPYLIVDINGNNQVQSDDVTQIQRAIVGLSTLQIPPHPGLTPAAVGGPDPIVSIPKNLTASVGETVIVPVELFVTEPTGITLAGADIAIAYDAQALELSDADVGQLLIGFGLSVNTTTPGVIRLTLAGSPLDLAHATSGVLANLQFTVLAGTGTTSSINLLQSSATLQTALYDDAGDPLTLSPAPTDSDDDLVDGLLTIEPRSQAAAVDAALAEEALW